MMQKNGTWSIRHAAIVIVVQSGWLFFEVKSKLCAWLKLLRCDVEDDDDDDYDKVPGTTIIERKRRSRSRRESGSGRR